MRPQWEVVATSTVVDCDTPVSLFLKLRSAAGACVLLDSAQAHPRSGRFSLIGLAEEVDAWPSVEAAAAHLESIASIEQRTPDGRLPPFVGGFVIASDGAERCITARIATVVALDNVKQTLSVVAAIDPTVQDPEVVRTELTGIQRLALADTTLPGVPDFSAREPGSRTAPDEGSWAFDGDPFDVYRTLRVIDATPYMAYVQAEGLALAGAGTHSFVAVHGQSVTARELAISLPLREHRGDDQEEVSAALAKNGSERLHRERIDVLTDVLDATCTDVRVSEWASLERHITASHVISTLQAELRADASAMDVMLAAVASRAADGSPRPFIGFVGADGQMDSCHLTESITVRDGRVEMREPIAGHTAMHQELAGALSSLERP